MALLVQKFGGTSLATIAHINHAADLVVKAKQAGHKVVVVVSAMSGETDKLISLAHQICNNPNTREYAALVSSGEQVSMSLMSMALINKGIEAKSYTGVQAGILTTNQFKKARIKAINTKPILQDLDDGKVVVIAGFQGVDEEGNITILGRGGSDTTAVAIAAALEASECQIYTDVDGVYTTDPGVASDAQRLSQISFEEMLELSSLGAKVLQIRSVEFAKKYNMPIRVLSSMKEGPGTLINYHATDDMDVPVVTGIAFNRNEAKISLFGVPNSPQTTSIILQEINSLGVSADMLTHHFSLQNTVDFSFTVHCDEFSIILEELQKKAECLGATHVIGSNHFAKLSVVGIGLKSHPEIAPLMFKTLANKGIIVQMIATSEIKISILIDADCLDEGVRALHQAFQLPKQLIY